MKTGEGLTHGHQDLDGLTGLMSHSKMQRSLETLLAEAKPAVAVLMVEILNLSAFNDAFGFEAGDEILRRVGQRLAQLAGQAQVAARDGSGRFVVALGHCSADECKVFIGRIAAELAMLRFATGAVEVPISFAFGYAVAPSDGLIRADLLELCRYRCKLSREHSGAPVGKEGASAYQLHGTFEGIEPIVEALLNRDPWTRIHLLHVNSVVKAWADFNLELGPDEVELLLRASLLHDVGKLLISDSVLLKPASLTDSEYRAIQHHAEYGKDILARRNGYEEVAVVIGQHHERWDGNGYPARVAGSDIHPVARAISVVDAFSAMVMDRSYHCGIAEAEALAELELCAGTQFDPYFVERFTAFRRSGDVAA
jgi:diguanylate cyclase (GGDEF)-like protein/putative nucleotidyltransferase with HDIG domain